MQLGESKTRVAVLIFTDLVGSMALKAEGVPAYKEALSFHNACFQDLVRRYHKIRILQYNGDGYLAEATSVTEALLLALHFQDSMRIGPWSGVRLETRIGVHVGEVTEIEVENGSGIVGPAVDVASRIMGLAVGGQILLTRFPFDEARPFVRAHPDTGRTMPPLSWRAHGPYLLLGCTEPVEIFEVGAESLAPLAPPPDGPKGRRAVRPGEEDTLGWRPALNLEIPGRPGWRLIKRLGVGGFGEVWIGQNAKLGERHAFKFCFDAERLRALKREVTLVRLVRNELGDRDDIVRLFDLKLDNPPFYLESELASHGNLLQWSDARGGLENIPLVQRVELVANTATALAAAHSVGVLHKDIKPTNILIFDGPEGPRPRLVDFGIGAVVDPSILDERGIPRAGFTQTSIQATPGTPTYSPPEYVAGRPFTIQGDIYALGVLLYQLVAAKPTDPIALGWERDVADDLLRDDIAACVDGDPARRLQSAADLAERLRCLEERRAAIAETRRIARAAAERAEAEAAAVAARKRAAQFRKLATAFAILTILAIAGGLSAWINKRRADRKNNEYRAMLVEAARTDRINAEEYLRVGRQAAMFALLARAGEYDPTSTLGAEKVFAALNCWRQPLPIAILTGHEGELLNLQISPDGRRVVTTSEDTTARVWDVPTGKLLITLAGEEGWVQSAQFSPNGDRLVTVADHKTPRIWNVATGKVLATLYGHDKKALSANFSFDGTRVVTTSEDHTARVWDASSGKELFVLIGHENYVITARFNQDDTRIVTTGYDNTARVWDAASGKQLFTLVGHTNSVTGAQFSPDGARILTASADNTARIWDATTGKLQVTMNATPGETRNAQFSPDGNLILTTPNDKTTASWDMAPGKGDREARLWDAVSGRELLRFVGHTAPVTNARFSPDGARIVTASQDRTAIVWDAKTGNSLATLGGHNDQVISALFSPDGSNIVTGSSDKTARIWKVPVESPKTVLIGHTNGTRFGEFNYDGTRIVTASEDKTARIWDPSTGATIAILVGHTDDVEYARFSPDARRIVTASFDNTARIWDATTGKELIKLIGHKEWVLSVRFSRDGNRIATGSFDGTARTWDAATGKALAILPQFDNWTSIPQFNPDGTRIAMASRHNTARVHDALTGTLLLTLVGHEQSLKSAAFSPDGTRIVTASIDKTARIWDAVTGKTLLTLTGHEQPLSGAQFSPDGKCVITTSFDKTARAWDPAVGKQISVMGPVDNLVAFPHVSPDGKRIVAASADNTARIWDLSSGKMLATLKGHDGSVANAQFSPDGARVLTTSADNTARIWMLLPPGSDPPPAWFSDLLRYIAQMRVNSDGELETLTPTEWFELGDKLRNVLAANTNKETPYVAVLRKYLESSPFRN